MIRDDNELVVTRKRTAYLLGLLERLSKTSRPEEFPLVAGGYRSEIERMRREVTDYLQRIGATPGESF